MEKERISRERIRLDLLKAYYRTLWAPLPIILFVIASAFPLLFVVAGILTMMLPSDMAMKIAIGIIIAYIVLCLTLTVVAQVHNIRAIINLKKNQFFIFTDEIIGKEEGHGHPAIGHHLHEHKLHALHFKCYGKFEIPYGNHYPWSKNGSIRDSGIFRGANVGDAYLLASADGKHIDRVYSTKLFELID